MVKISVIVPVFNMEKYIERTLNSLIGQTLKDIEIIVVNDGSTDNSKKIIEEKFMNEIIYLEKQNGGLSSSRNFGMQFAKGEYIAFLDADDYVEKGMYEKMYKKAKQEDADMVECNFIWEYENFSKKDIRKYKNKKEMFKRPRVVVWNKIIKKEIAIKTQFPNGLIYEDIEYFIKIYPFINKICYVDDFFVHYVQRKNSISNTYNEKVADIFKIWDNIYRFYLSNGMFEKYKKQLKILKRRILIGSSLKRILKIRNKRLKKKLIKKTLIELFKKQELKAISNHKKIVFGITKLGIGGAERVLVDIANALVKKKVDVTLFTIYSGGELEKQLDSEVKLISIFHEKKSTIFSSFLPLYVVVFRKMIFKKYLEEKFDVMVAFLEGPITRIFSYGGQFAWVHNDINNVFGKGLKAIIKKKIDKHFYQKYKKIFFVSKQNKEAFENLYGDISNREVIYNYIDRQRILNLANKQNVLENENCKVLVTVSRLVKQKAIDRFIKIHKRLIDAGFYHKVYVIGDGEEKENLVKQAKNLNVENTFCFLGKKENPYPYIKKADYFVLLSYYEGYGMAIEEAKILEKNIIITNTAAVEAVKGYKKSLVLKNNEQAIFWGLKEVLKSKQVNIKIKKNFTCTILTATYNRARYLTNLYESIKNGIKKCNMKIEWIIVDDGSIDNTKEVVKNFNQKNFKIKYIYQQNSGKMEAINRAMEEATGDLIVDCDSDDYFSKDAFNIIEKKAPYLLENENLYALCFLKQTSKGYINRKYI